ncbi:hypothetical protein T12_3398 [Trichinella patagoniensis]|uniref:Uncharacterized protein n=1 Tax=Trichinella patagoniensis TaxID=990121 RepID=A0A0V0Z5X8_9BILA|nr:hypothetical protein T12_3398 [Trichinella patagoniensis]
MSKGARKHHLGFYQFLQLIIDEQGKTDMMARKWMIALRGEESSDQQRLAAAVTYKLHRNEISTEHFSPIVAKSRNVSVQSSLLISTDMKK